MKPNYTSQSRLFALIVCGLTAFIAVSCGSYQNSTADRDGIYGDSSSDRRSQNSENATYYRNYFGNLHDETLVYTDAERYSSDSTQTEQPREAAGYAGWGSQPDNITVNVYGNSWGYWNDWYAPSWGWGWNRPYWGIGWSSWYGPSWSIGWGWNSWYGPGWGWNSWYGPGWGYGGWYAPYWYGYNSPYYGYYGHSYAYSPGRRGSYYDGGLRGNTMRSTYSPNTRRSYESGTRTPNFSNGTRNSNSTRTVRSTNGSTRYDNTGGVRPSQPTRSNSGNVRQSTAPTRTYSPSTSGGTRSSGGSYGGGGGTRSGGGGGRR